MIKFKKFIKKRKKNVFDYDLKYYPSNIKIYSKNDIMFGIVFQKMLFFRDKYGKSEFEKFDYDIGHMYRFIWRYSDFRWFYAYIDIENLLNVYMCPVGWLRRFACVKKSCPEFKNEDCIECKDDSMMIFTLRDVCEGYKINKTKFTDKIEKIKSRVQKDYEEQNQEEYLFCTLIQNKYRKYFVLDGNSRLLAFALFLQENKKIDFSKAYSKKIECYIGERK